VADRPYTLLSCAMSLDGYIGTAMDERLLLSNAADLDRVERVRARCDAILVGAATIRCDDPRLTVRSPTARQEREADGLSATPTKVTLTRGGELDPGASFFATGDTEKLVYCDSAGLARARTRLGHVATVVDGGHPLEVRCVGEDLAGRGVQRLLVEGGGTMHTQFLTGDLADELQLVVAPFFVGDPAGRRFVGTGRFPWHPGRRARLVETRPIGDVVLMRYALSDRFDEEEGR